MHPVVTGVATNGTEQEVNHRISTFEDLNEVILVEGEKAGEAPRRIVFRRLVKNGLDRVERESTRDLAAVDELNEFHDKWSRLDHGWNTGGGPQPERI